MYGIMGGMEKTTVYLTAEQKAALARAAAAEGRSEARLIRAGIDVVTAGHRASEAPAALGGGPADVPTAPHPAVGTPPPSSAPPAAHARPRWVARDAFLSAILRHQADPGLGRELRELAPGTTDDAPIR